MSVNQITYLRLNLKALKSRSQLLHLALRVNGSLVRHSGEQVGNESGFSSRKIVRSRREGWPMLAMTNCYKRRCTDKGRVLVYILEACCNDEESCVGRRNEERGEAEEV